MAEFPFAGRPDATRSGIRQVADAERRRQWRTLIMIPSESICHPEAAAMVAGELGMVGAVALLLLMCALVGAAVAKARANGWDGWAVLGAAAGLSISGWFTSPMVRGCGGALAGSVRHARAGRTGTEPPS